MVSGDSFLSAEAFQAVLWLVILCFKALSTRVQSLWATGQAGAELGVSFSTLSLLKEQDFFIFFLLLIRNHNNTHMHNLGKLL